MAKNKPFIDDRVRAKEQAIVETRRRLQKSKRRLQKQLDSHDPHRNFREGNREK